MSLPYLKFSDPLPETHLFFYLALSQFAYSQFTLGYMSQIVKKNYLKGNSSTENIQELGSKQGFQYTPCKNYVTQSRIWPK